MWKSILVKTPQAHGRLVASWSYSVNSPIIVDRSDWVISNEDAKAAIPPYRFKGHPDAIRIAYSASEGNASSFKLGDTIYFANGADHGEGPYSEFIENISDTDPNWLFYKNKPGYMVKRTLQMIDGRYANGIDDHQASELKRWQLS